MNKQSLKKRITLSVISVIIIAAAVVGVMVAVNRSADENPYTSSEVVALREEAANERQQADERLEQGETEEALQLYRSSLEKYREADQLALGEELAGAVSPEVADLEAQISQIENAVTETPVTVPDELLPQIDESDAGAAPSPQFIPAGPSEGVTIQE